MTGPLRRINDIADLMSGTVTYELPDGMMCRLDARAVERYGVEALLRDMGIDVEFERVPVKQRGDIIGSVPGTFDPQATRSRSFLYDIRQGDFTLEDGTWIADRMLGPGDLSAVPGFQWIDDPQRAERDMADDNKIMSEVLRSMASGAR